MKHRMLAVTIVALIPGVLGAQATTQAQGSAKASANAAAQAERGLQTAADARAQARIDATMKAAAEAKIPVSLLASKVAEGEAKRVSEDRIATAVEARYRALVRASSMLKRADVEQQGAAELAVAADAVEAGVSDEAVIRVSRSAPAERRVVAIAVLTDLVRLGRPTDAALAQVTAAAGTSAGLANLNAQVGTQLRAGGLTSTLDASGMARIP